MTPATSRGDATRIDRLRVEVGGEVDPHVVAAAVRRRIAGDAWPAGPERQVADAVVDAVGAATVPESNGVHRNGGGVAWR